jgi:hypothetical protein
MQSGVAALMGQGHDSETEPKHLRVGVNSALCENGALVRLLIAKGVITADEISKASADEMEAEVRRYQLRLSLDGRIKLV